MTALWYTTRATGAVALILLTLVVTLGIAQTARLRTDRWPRFVIDGLHRFVALLSVVFLAVHIATAVLDSYAPISLLDAFVPFTGAYRPLWLGLGAAALDLLLAVGVTSVLRARLGHRAWRAAHWCAYGSWPLAFVHGFGTGSDAREPWMAIIDILCGSAVFVAVIVRLAIGWPHHRRGRLTAAACALAYLAALAIWLPSGPLAPHWASRAGTPPRLLSPGSSSPS